jgi:copper chaperone CopZ
LNPLERGINVQTELLKVTGMTCGGCTGNVTRALKAVNGVGDVKVSLAAGEASVEYDDVSMSFATVPEAYIAWAFGAVWWSDDFNQDLHQIKRSRGQRERNVAPALAFAPQMPGRVRPAATAHLSR